MASRIKESLGDRVFIFINSTIMIIIILVMLYPLYFVLIASLSNPQAVATGKVTIWIVDFALDSYKNMYKDSRIWVGYRNTGIYTIVGTLYNLAILLPAAYALSKRKLPGRIGLTWFFLFTMYFGGGMIPSYLLNNAIGWINTPYILMFSASLSAYNLVVTRTFFQSSIPEEVYESGRIDGASNVGLFFLIALPLSMPIIAVMALFYGVAEWNNWFTAFIYVSAPKYAPLQLVLRRILIDGETALSQAMEIGDMEGIEIALRRVLIAQGMKYSTIYIAALPLLCAYPFIQKYFVKGVMIGSLKG